MSAMTATDPEREISRRSDALNYLTSNHTSNLRVPCSRYGRDTEDCAPVAWRVAYLIAREQGEPVRARDLDHAMSLVVNDHDDPAYIIRSYGHRDYRR